MASGRPALIEPAASPEEAAAIVAALERFARETALPAPTVEPVDPWWRVAVLEGVLREDIGDDPVDIWHAWINA